MKVLQHLFENNRQWALGIEENEPGLFEKLSRQQRPKYFWIGCSDSRVPANQIIGLPPGEVFVHRNVANLVNHTDFNCLSALEYAVDVLRVEHVIVCGHYGCGGVTAALGADTHGFIDNWLNHVRDIAKLHEHALREIQSPEGQIDRLCEINVIQQVLHVCNTSIVQRHWDAGNRLSVHGWIYSISNGRLKDLGVCCRSNEELFALKVM